MKRTLAPLALLLLAVTAPAESPGWRYYLVNTTEQTALAFHFDEGVSDGDVQLRISVYKTESVGGTAISTTVELDHSWAVFDAPASLITAIAEGKAQIVHIELWAPGGLSSDVPDPKTGIRYVLVAEKKRKSKN